MFILTPPTKSEESIRFRRLQRIEHQIDLMIVPVENPPDCMKIDTILADETLEPLVRQSAKQRNRLPRTFTIALQ